MLTSQAPQFLAIWPASDPNLNPLHKMKILLANTTAYPAIGGTETSLRYIARELVQAGHEVTIFALRSSAGEPLRTEYEGVEVLRQPCATERWPHRRLGRCVWAAQNAVPIILDYIRPDAVWCQAVPFGVGLRRGGYRGPLVQIFPTNARMHCRGIFLQTRGLPISRRIMMASLWPPTYFAAHRLERELAPQCSPVTFSENMRQQLTRDLPAIRPVRVIPPGVDTTVFSPSNGTRFLGQIEQAHGLDSREPIVLYVGRLSTAKHIPMLIDAIASLKTRVRLLLVGDGPEDYRLREYARRKGVADQVIFAGRQHEMLAGYYSISRMTVLPTVIESFGLVLLESLASGTPVVGFAGDGRRVLTATQEIVRDGKTGAIVSEVSCNALAKKIDALLALSRNDRARMAREARKDAIQRFSWKRFTARALDLTRNACDGENAFSYSLHRSLPQPNDIEPCPS